MRNDLSQLKSSSHKKQISFQSDHWNLSKNNINRSLKIGRISFEIILGFGRAQLSNHERRPELGTHDDDDEYIFAVKKQKSKHGQSKI